MAPYDQNIDNPASSYLLWAWGGSYSWPRSGLDNTEATSPGTVFGHFSLETQVIFQLLLASLLIPDVITFPEIEMHL